MRTGAQQAWPVSRSLLGTKNLAEVRSRQLCPSLLRVISSRLCHSWCPCHPWQRSRFKVALIVCPECGKEFSDRAAACPHCGCPNDTQVGEAVDLAGQQRKRITSAGPSSSPDVIAAQGAQATKVIVNNNGCGSGCGSGCLKAIGYFIVFCFVLGAIGSIVDDSDPTPPNRIEKAQ